MADNTTKWAGDTTHRRAVGRAAGWLAAGSAATLVSVHAMTWGFAAIKVWALTAVSTVFLSTVLAAHTPSNGIPAAEPKTNAAITRLAEEYRQAVLAGNAQAVAATFGADAIELAPCAPPVVGREAIEHRYRDLFTGATVTAFTLSHIASTISGDLAFDVGTYEQRIAPAQGAPMIETGKYVVILGRARGAWKTAYAIYNSDSSAGPMRAGR